MQFVRTSYEHVEPDAVNLGPQPLIHEQLLGNELSYWQDALPRAGSPRTSTEAIATQLVDNLRVFHEGSRVLSDFAAEGGHHPEEQIYRRRIAAMYAVSLLMRGLVNENIPQHPLPGGQRERLVIDTGATEPTAFSIILGTDVVNRWRLVDPPAKYQRQAGWYYEPSHGMYLQIRLPVNASNEVVQSIQRGTGSTKRTVIESFSKNRSLQLYPYASFGALAIKG